MVCDIPPPVWGPPHWGRSGPKVSAERHYPELRLPEPGSCVDTGDHFIRIFKFAETSADLRESKSAIHKHTFLW